MSLSLSGDNRFPSLIIEGDMHRRLSPFSEKEGKLPSCYIHFSPPSETPTGKLLGQINEFCFHTCTDAVLISSGAGVVRLPNHKAELEAFMPENVSAMEAATLLMHGYQYVMLRAGGLLLHGAAVVLGGEGVVFCGVPGAGKSTQARLWQRHLDAAALNNDQPGLVFEGDKLFITGSAWSGKEPCYKNEAHPLRAIVFVEQAPVNEAVRLPAAEAYSRLYLNNYLFPISPQTESCYARRIEQIAAAVPAVLLRCTISEAAVRVAFGAVFPEKNYEKVRPVKYKANENFELKNIAGDWLLLPRGTFSITYSAVMVFNETGVFLWKLLSEERTEQALTEMLAAKYDVEPSVVEQDVAAFLKKLQENHMLAEA